MARIAGIWKRKDNGFYYTTLRGRKIKLSQDRKEAQQLFHALMAKEEGPNGTVVSMTFGRLADLYLDEVQRLRKPNTYRVHRHILQTLCDRAGKKRVVDLRVLHVTEWIAAQKTWGDSTACSVHPAGLPELGCHARPHR
jgi:hypothetical protein